MRCAKSQRTVVDIVGDGVYGSFAYAYYGGQYHDAQQQRCGKQGKTAAAEEIPHEGNQHHQPEEAVYHGGDACKQFKEGVQQAVELFGAEAGHKYGGKQPQGHAYKHCAKGYKNTAAYHGKQTVNIVFRHPLSTGEKIPKAYCLYGGSAPAEDEYDYYKQSDNGDAGAYKEYEPAAFFRKPCLHSCSFPRKEASFREKYL